MEFRTFGIIGYGHFGELLARSLSRHGRVVVTDVDPSRAPRGSGRVRAGSLEDVAGADAVIAAVPFSALENVLKEVRDLLPRTTVVMDVVSTKERATGLLRDVLAGHPHLLATHPLFGPPSMRSIRAGARLVVTYERGRRATGLRQFLEKRLGLEVVKLSSREHDRLMAYMQSLPFFIARALMRMGLPEDDRLVIPSFEKLAQIADIEAHHTVDMFDTSQASNPYADEARERFLVELTRLQAEIRGTKG